VLALTLLLYPIPTLRCTLEQPGAHELVAGTKRKEAALKGRVMKEGSRVDGLLVLHHGAAVARDLAIFLAGDDAHIHTALRLRYLLIAVLVALVV
jgi:hypothetical protein